jgi:hypothetical protein
MRTSITSITVYLNESETDYRETKITQSDFKNMVDNYRKPKAQTQSPKKEKRSTRSTVARPSKVAASPPPLRFIEDLGTTLDEFATQCNDVVKAMSSNYKELKKRTHPEFYMRLIASGGLYWNKDSKNRGRDYLLAATAAVLESHFVPMYRPELLSKSPGAKVLRKELSDYLFSIAKLNYIERKRDANEDVRVDVREDVGEDGDGDGDEAQAEHKETVKEWKFADLLEVESGPFKKLHFSADSQESLLHGSMATAKENDENDRMIQKFVKSESLACMTPNVKKGAVETAAHTAIGLLNNVGRTRSHFSSQALFRVLMDISPQVIHLKKAYNKFVRSGGNPALFDFSSVGLLKPIEVPHHATKGVMEALGLRASDFARMR